MCKMFEVKKKLKLDSYDRLPIIGINNTRQGYAFESILKQAGYFFLADYAPSLGGSGL